MGKNEQYHFGIASSQVRKEAIALHRMRYEEVGFLTKEEVDIYEKNSVYFVAQESRTNQVVGVTRLIFQELEELPTFINFEIYNRDFVKLMQLEEHTYAEMSAFTKLQKHEVGIHLIRSIFQYSNQHGITHWIASIDERVYRYLNRIFSEIFKEIGVRRAYMGSVSVPCVVDLKEAMVQIKERRPRLHEFLSEVYDQVLEVLR